MARRRAIEPDELFETANRLQAEGKEVTAVALLDALGGGSLRTIYKHLETWQQMRPAVITTAPEEIPGSVQSAFASAWRLANQEAGRQVSAVKEKAAEEVTQALKQFQEALDAIGKLEAESDADAQQIDGLKQRVSELESALQKETAESAGHKAAAEQLKHQVKSQEAELERLHKEMDRERTERQQEIQRITTAAEAAQTKAALELEAIKGALSEAQSKRVDLEKALAEAVSKRDESQRLLEKAEEASKSDRAERDAALKDAAELKGQTETLRAQNSELMAKLAAPKRTKQEE